MLKFFYGVMGSSKSLQLLIQRYNLAQLGKQILTMKINTDTRDVGWIRSRVGLECKVDYQFSPLSQLELLHPNIFEYYLVDEAQFLNSFQVERLKRLSLDREVYAYGLKTNFKGELFEGSKRLLELADVIEEIPTVCKRCDEKAIFNMRIDKDGKKVMDGEVVQIGGDESYIGVCSYHYNE